MSKRGCAFLALVALLSGCASEAAPKDSWNRWVCDNRMPVLWREAGADAVDLRLAGGDIAHRLHRQPSTSGALYRDEVLALQMKDDDEGLVYRVVDKRLVGAGCKAR